MFTKLWNAPNIKGQTNLKQLVGATAVSAVVGVVLLTIAKALEANSSAFGKWGAIVGSVATLIVQVLTMLNIGVDPTPTPTPTPNIPPDRFVTPA